MLFTETSQHPHIHLIRSGAKTETRRVSKRWQMKVGGVYAAHAASGGLFQRRQDAEAFIECTARWKERVRDMDEESFSREGGYTFEEFRDLWIEINGEWDPDQEVKVYRFIYIGDEDPEAL